MPISHIDYTNAFDCVDHSKLWKILKEVEVQDYLTFFLRNLYVGHEMTELNMEQVFSSKLGREYQEAVY